METPNESETRFQPERVRCSIIIPCYNHGRYLAEALDSVLAQTYDCWEAIVVNDGSTDNSSDIAAEYCRKDSRIRLINQSNHGLPKTRNRAVSVASGKYLMFLDSDNKMAPDYIKTGVEYMETHPDCTLFCSTIEYFGGTEGIYELHYTGYANLLLGNSIDCACIVRKTDFDSVGGFDESIIGLEDWELFIRMLYPDKQIYRHPEVLFYYRKIGDGTNLNAFCQRNSNTIESYIFKKHFDKYVEFWSYPMTAYRNVRFFRALTKHPLMKISYKVLYLYNKYIKHIDVFDL